MNELELLKKRVEELEMLVKGLLCGDERVINLANIPIANLVLGKGCQVTMQNCPLGTVFYGDQDCIEEVEERLGDLAGQAEELEGMIDDLEGRLDDIRSELDTQE